MARLSSVPKISLRVQTARSVHAVDVSALMTRQWLRHIILFGALFIAGSLLAGCGGGVVSAAAVSTTTPITKTEATAYAHIINLRAADVPEMRISAPAGEAPEPTRSTVVFDRCYGGVSQRRIAKIHSQEFSVGRGAQAQLEESEVEVMPTPSLETRNNAADRSSRYRACFKRFQEVDNKNRNKQRVGQLLYGPLTISPVRSPLPALDGGYGLRIDQTLLRGGQIRIRIYHDVFGFSSGPAEIILTATGFSRPVPSSTERRLLSLLYSRAKANEL